MAVHAVQWGAPILDAPTGRRDDFVDPYFRRAQPDQIVVILKAREPARMLVASGKDDRWHLEYKQRWVNQYNFYLQDREWGRLFVRVCPYLPFSARICLNQHHWLARVAHAVVALSASPRGFTTSDLACQVERLRGTPRRRTGHVAPRTI